MLNAHSRRRVLFATLLCLAGCGAPHLQTVKRAKPPLIGEEVAVLTMHW
jgi:hypothetical protein